MLMLVLRLQLLMVVVRSTRANQCGGNAGRSLYDVSIRS